MAWNYKFTVQKYLRNTEQLYAIDSSIPCSWFPSHLDKSVRTLFHLFATDSRSLLQTYCVVLPFKASRHQRPSQTWSWRRRGVHANFLRLTMPGLQNFVAHVTGAWGLIIHLSSVKGTRRLYRHKLSNMWFWSDNRCSLNSKFILWIELIFYDIRTEYACLYEWSHMLERIESNF